jgi:hypothetical protein
MKSLLTFEVNQNDPNQFGLIKIRPKIILQRLENSFKRPVEMKMNIPSSEIGSLTTIEATMLICLIKLIKPSKIFEFGTFLGYSTSLFLKNSNKKCVTISIDLGTQISYNELKNGINENDILKNDKTNDDYLRIVQSKSGPIYIKTDIERKNNRLILLNGDSREISLERLGIIGAVNFVFIDGGHTYDIVKSDTEKALKMVKKGIIVWHDYNSKIHGDVTSFVDQLSSSKKIFHIENTMLAFHIVE